MTQKSIKEIIRKYSETDAPEPVRDSFEKWMTENADIEEKSEAMSELWEEVNALPEERFSGKGLMNADELISAGGKSAGTKKRSVLWLSTAAAVILAFISVFQLHQFLGQDVCLMSSEMSNASFVLPDGSKVWLNKDSRLTYSHNLKGRNRVVRLVGEGYFDVSKDADHPFIVKTEGLDIRVLGTKFTVSAYGGEAVSAYLAEGCIAASASGKREKLILEPDQSVTFDRLSKEMTLKAEDASIHTEWMKEKLEFEDIPLTDILTSLSHWYHIDIKSSCPDQLKNISLTMTVRDEPVQEIIETICLLAPVRYSFDGKRITISTDRQKP